MPQPLNVLLITSDQQRWDTLGSVNPLIRTPHLDALASRGILFDRAYTCNPVCTPARVSILTGEYPSRHGCYTIGTSLPETYPTIPGHLSRHGCFTALIGKAHFQPCTDQPTGYRQSFEAPPKIFDHDFFRRWSGPFYGFNHVQLAIAHSVEANACGMHYGVWLKDRGVTLDRYFGRNAYTDWGTWELPEEYGNSRWTADTTIAALDLARKNGPPFFIWSSFQDPHNPCMVSRPWDRMYDPARMRYLPLRPGEFDDKPPFYEALQRAGCPLGDPDLDGAKNWYCVRGLPTMDDRATRGLIACYYGMVSQMDQHIGRILRRLDETGLAQNTVVVFTTDHGDYLGSHGLWWKGLPAYEDAQRIPFIVAHPHCRTPGQRSRAMQSLVDIGPTACALSGVPAEAGVQGVDQSTAWLDADSAARDWALIEYRPTEGPFMQKTLVHDRWKLVIYHNREYGELYDLEHDPDQYRNLWRSPRHQTTKRRLLERLVSAGMEQDGLLRPRLSWA